MNPILRNILGVIAGCVIGAFVNMAIVTLGTYIVPAPEGVDPKDINSIKANIHLYQFKHFIVPFIAHAAMALFGGFVAARIAATNQIAIALGVGFFCLIGGIAMILMLPESPMWFKALDLLVAYLPMAYLGAKLAGGNRPLPVVRRAIKRDDILDQP